MTYRLRNIGIAIALAVVAALLTTFYVTNYKRSVQQGESKVPVYVASHDIALGTPGADVAQGNMFKVEQVPRRSVVPGRSPSRARSTSSSPWSRSTPASRSRPAVSAPRRNRASGPAQGQPPRRRGAGNDHQLLNGTLKDGDRVDILGNWLLPETSQNHISRVLLRNILVLQAPETNSVSSHLSANPNEGFTVMLALTDSQATKFWWVVNNGDWSLQLRPLTDPSDSPEEVNNATTNAVDGINGRQRHRARSGR